MAVYALVDDLMDRSRVSAAISDVTFVREASGLTPATVVIVDLARYGDRVAAIRAAAPNARIIGFGSHVARDALAAARNDGADEVLARSEFFRDPASYTSGQGYER